MSEQYPWTLETMRIINELTKISGKAFDPDWFLQLEDALRDRERFILNMRRNQTGVKGS